MTGATRGELVEARERIRAKLLNKALLVYHTKKARPVMSWKQRDKISSSWFLALPGGGMQLTNEKFSEAAAANLCLPSPG